MIPCDRMLMLMNSSRFYDVVMVANPSESEGLDDETIRGFIDYLGRCWRRPRKPRKRSKQDPIVSTWYSEGRLYRDVI